MVQNVVEHYPVQKVGDLIDLISELSKNVHMIDGSVGLQ